MNTVDGEEVKAGKRAGNYGVCKGYFLKQLPTPQKSNYLSARKTDQEKQWPITKPAINGILDYAKDYAKYYRLFNFEPTQLLPEVKNDIQKWVSFPSKRDVKMLNGLFLTATWPSERNMDLIKTIKWADLVKINSFVQKLYSSLWYEGTLKSAPIPGLNWIYYKTVTSRAEIYRIASKHATKTNLKYKFSQRTK